ncbi:MAG: hypothetical protein ACREJ2_12165 [Planctomycetota bacterium]
MPPASRPPLSLRALAIQYVAKHLPRLIDAMDKHGWILSDHHFVDNVHTEYHQYGFFCFAELYTLKHPRNPYFQNPKLLKAALKAGDLAARETDDAGLTLFSSQGYSWSRSHMGWRTYWLMQTYLRLKSHLGAERDRLWRAAIDKQLVGTLQSIEGRRKEAEYCRHGHVHNLYMWSTLCLHRARTDFGRADLGALADEIFRETAAAVRPAGCWSENGGPVAVYDHVTAAALSIYAEETQAPWARETLRKNLEFHLNTTYPDLCPVETFDGRVRYTHYPITILPPSWGTFPEGRGFVRALIRAALKTPFGGGDQPHGPWLGYPFMGEAIRFLPDDVLPDETWKPQAVYRMPEEPACVVRSEPWTFSAAAICVPPLPSQRWWLARQNLFSLFHPKHGLILGGGNSKELEFSTVVVHEKDGAIRYVPQESALTVAADGKAATLNLRYGRSRIEAQLAVVSVTQAELRFKLLEAGDAAVVYGQATFLPHMGDKLSWGRGSSAKLGDQRIALSDYELTGKKAETDATHCQIGWKRIAVQLPEGSFVRWPLEPFNTHRVDNRYPPYKRVLGVEVPLKTGETRTIRIDVR